MAVEPLTRRPFVTWGLEDIQPFFGAYVSPNDRLALHIYNAATGTEVQVAGRVLTFQKDIVPFSQLTTPTTDRVRTEQFIDLPEGFIHTCVVTINAGVVRRGQCYIRLLINRGRVAGGISQILLASGYISNTNWLTWPPGRATHSLEAPGGIRLISGTDPAAGAEISETVPTSARWRLLTIRYTLVTSAVAGTRRSNLVLDDGTTIFARHIAGVTQGVSTTLVYNWGVGLSRLTAAVTGETMDPFIDYVQLRGAFRFRTDTTSLDAGDNYSAPDFLVEEWIEL